MNLQEGAPLMQPAASNLWSAYCAVRAATVALVAPLAPEDQVVQSMPDVSPTKWHLAHTTWFFENFLLREHLKGYQPYHPQFGFLFNSYYQAVGPMHARPHRGLLSRPNVAEVLRYREAVDERMRALIEKRGAEVAGLIELGLHHERQHQELILTDIKHVLAQNPLAPAYRAGTLERAPAAPALRWVARAEGLTEIGHAGPGFAFDNESPRHRVWLDAHAIANRPVTNSEFRDFIRDGGYRRPELWLSDGCDTVRAQQWSRPLYWTEDGAQEFTLRGMQPLDPNAPVCHVGYYEADAYARWTGARLPTEAEWEAAAADARIEGNFVESGRLHPAAATNGGAGLLQAFGDVWEWTASPYVPYPGYRAPAGVIGEYNGKFMCNQLVLRGGSAVSPQSHLRASYRNFFYPASRWQFSGIRLAKDLS